MKPLFATLLAGATLLTAIAPAQRLTSYGSGGFGMNSPYAKLYSTSTVVTFRGKITGVTIGAPIGGAGNSVRIVVKSTNGGSSLVELGPEWFVKNQSVKLKPKSNVTVTGSKIMLDGRGSIMAQKVVVGRKSLVLRDASGNPYWAANSMAFSVAPVSSGTAAQEISNVNGAPVRNVQVLPVGGTQPVFAAPAVATGMIDHFNFADNGDVYMIVNVNGVMRNVYLGPNWYIQRQDAVLNPGDFVTMNLLTPINDPNRASYAQSVSANGQTMFFRNNSGAVTWAPWYQYPVLP